MIEKNVDRYQIEKLKIFSEIWIYRLVVIAVVHKTFIVHRSWKVWIESGSVIYLVWINWLLAWERR
jgi:hypothetical protein